MVRRDGFITLHDRGEAPGQVGDFAEGARGAGGAGEAENVGEAGGGPVEDDVDGEEEGAEGVEPPG